MILKRSYDRLTCYLTNDQQVDRITKQKTSKPFK